MSEASDRADRAIKDELIGGIVHEQKIRGNQPDPEKAKRYIEAEKIMEKADAAHAARLAAPKPKPPEKDPDLRAELGHSDLLGRDVVRNPDVVKKHLTIPQVNAKQTAARMRADIMRNWLGLVRKYDPQFGFDMKLIVDNHAPLDENFVPRLTEKGRDLMNKLIAGALDKYGDPINPTKRIQVG